MIGQDEAAQRAGVVVRVGGVVGGGDEAEPGAAGRGEARRQFDQVRTIGDSQRFRLDEVRHAAGL